ncbi:MAG: sialate O-acetylesterase [Verrucomicrobiales bacterium]|nr:sialate O-acetylesterase [Verrucomicrobiales bacterium]
MAAAIYRTALIAMLICIGQTVVAAHFHVYLIGGQSNAQGRGDASRLPARLAEPQKDVRFYWHRTQDTDNVGHLKEDLWIDLAPGSGHGRIPPVREIEFGPEISFGRSLADHYSDVSIAVIKYSHGGSNLHSDWAEDGVRYRIFVATVRAALAALEAEGHQWELRGMIWQQGEGDTGSPHAENYAKHLGDLISRVRRDLFEGAARPFVIGGLSVKQSQSVKTPGSGMFLVRKAQETVAQADPTVGFVNTDDFSTREGDRVHFDHRGLISLGEAHAAEMIRLEDSVAKTATVPCTVPKCTGCTFEKSDNLRPLPSLIDINKLSSSI